MSADEGLREFIVHPAPPPSDRGGEEGSVGSARPRVIGPGRFERGYLERLSGLAAQLESERERERRLSESLRASVAALEMSQRVEHGCQRRIDRLEVRLEERTQALLESERQHKRLALALGAMQRENEMLRSHLPKALSSSERHGLERGGADRGGETHPRAGLWRRILRGVRGR